MLCVHTQGRENLRNIRLLRHAGVTSFQEDLLVRESFATCRGVSNEGYYVMSSSGQLRQELAHNEMIGLKLWRCRGCKTRCCAVSGKLTLETLKKPMWSVLGLNKTQ
jgi:hypothetical protein